MQRFVRLCGPTHSGNRGQSRLAQFTVPWFMTCLLGLTLCGCTSVREWHANGFKVGPNYGPPPAPVAEDWIDAADERVRKEEPNLGQWWLAFNDPALTALVENAYLQNLTLREAGFRVLQARAERRFAAGTLFPQIQEATADYSRNQLSRNVINQGFAPEKSFDLWDNGFNLAWELDFWGRFRRAIEVADAELDASVENYDDVMVTLLADVASNYVQYRTLQRRIELARANVETQRGTLGIAEVRFRNGATTELDVVQGKAILAQTDALVPSFEIALRQANNQLCILLGIPPHDLQAELGAAPIPTPPSAVAVGIPADLLRRRPDVRRAERQLAAQSARIGVAVSDLYPHISLAGTIGLQANELTDLVTSPSLRGAVGPSLRWDILHYGRIAANIGVQDARFQQLATFYQNEVLTANEEAENSLLGFLRSQTQREYLQQGVDATVRANSIVVVQYREGIVDYTRVFQIQQDLVVQQDQEAFARGNVALNLISLYRALGGGWELRLRDVTSEPTVPAENEAIGPGAVAPAAPPAPGQAVPPGRNDPGVAPQPASEPKKPTD